MRLPDPHALRNDPEVAVLAVLDATLVATSAALAAQHDDLHVACWGPNAAPHVRLAAAIVAAAEALRQLVDEYDRAVDAKAYDEIPY